MTILSVTLSTDTMRELSALAEIVGRNPTALAAHFVARGTRNAIAKVREGMCITAQPPEPSAPADRQPLPEQLPIPERAPKRAASRGGYRRRSPAMIERDRLNILDMLCTSRAPLSARELASRLGRRDRAVYNDCHQLARGGLLVETGRTDGKWTRFKPAPKPSGEDQSGGRL